MTERPVHLRAMCVALALSFGFGSAWPQAARRDSAARSGDYIVAVVNQELVTAGEVNLRMARMRADAQRGGQTLPPAEELRQQLVDQLIDERVVVTYARDSGARIDDADIDRAAQGVAAQNQLNMEQLRERLKQDGMDMTRFRNNLRDQLLVERVREREVGQRIRVSDNDIDRWLAEQAAAAVGKGELNIAQILISVPERATQAVQAEKLARARRAIQRVREGDAFDAVARELSDDANRERGGEIGLRPLSRLPDAFVDAVKGFQVGEVSSTPLRTGAGYHVLKLVQRKDYAPGRITQTHARHILLRPSAQLSAEVAARRLAEFKRQIEQGSARFEDLARQHSEDGSAPQGGDLGWVSPGAFVPEFEEAMNRLDLGGLSDPVASRFGLHLIQVQERRDTQLDIKQVREQARNVLREQKFDEVYAEWTKELRRSAYIEMREPPQ